MHVLVEPYSLNPLCGSFKGPIIVCSTLRIGELSVINLQLYDALELFRLPLGMSNNVENNYCKILATSFYPGPEITRMTVFEATVLLLPSSNLDIVLPTTQ